MHLVSVEAPASRALRLLRNFSLSLNDTGCVYLYVLYDNLKRQEPMKLMNDARCHHVSVYQ